MTHYTKIKDFAEILTDSHRRCESFYQGVVNYNLVEASILGKLLHSVSEPAWELIVKFITFWKFYSQEISTDHESTPLNDLAQEFQLEVQRLAPTFALAIEKLRSDKSIQIDQTEKYYDLTKYFFPLIADITDAERIMIYEGSLFPNVVMNHKRQCDSSNIELSQGTKPSEQTPGNRRVSPVVENCKTKILNDTFDKPFITSDTSTKMVMLPMV